MCVIEEARISTHSPNPDNTVAPPTSSARAPRWPVRFLAWLLRGFYFRSVRIVGTQRPLVSPRVGRLIVSSHRNGAIDGYVVMRAFPDALGLASVQLLQHPILRWMFDGIEVIREKDRERYGGRLATLASPVEAGCTQLRGGGDLLIFPEGTSEWGYRPLPYQRGAARIARTLLAEGVTLEVVPLGLHYQASDRFRSDVEILAGASLELPARIDDETDRQWELRIHHAITEALDAVSVNCPDATDFATAETHAKAAAMDGGSYAQAFIDAQQRLQAHAPLPPAPPVRQARAWPWDWIATAIFMLLTAPVLMIGRFVGGKADARNTVSFFRMIGGLLATLLWLPCLVVATCFWPWPMLALGCVAVLGWWRWPRVMHRDFQ